MLWEPDHVMRIGVVSDTHLARRAPAFCRNWEVARDFLVSLSPDLIVHLGDISADGAGSADDLAEAAACFESLATPMRFLPGNHDLGDNPIRPGEAVREHPVSPERLARYRRIFGRDRWVHDLPGWRLTGLNAQLLGTGTREEENQFAWLADALADPIGPAIGLLLHKPLFRDGPADTEAHVRYVPAAARGRLLSLLEGRELRFVLSGHAHQSRSLVVGGVQHVWAPSTAFRIADGLQETIGAKRVGVLLLHLDRDGGHAFEEVSPPGLPNHDLLDFPDVYPEVAALARRSAPVEAAS